MRYVWDMAAGLPVVLKEQDLHNTLDGHGTDNTYVYGLDLVSVTDRTGAQTYFVSDGLGSTANLTDGSGNTTATYSYDVFGSIRSESGAGAAGNEWRFTGEQRDPQANRNLYYLRARYYDPGIGRFLSQDPLGVGNLYGYVGGNPVNLIDPSGMASEGGGCISQGLTIPAPGRSRKCSPVWEVCLFGGTCFLSDSPPRNAACANAAPGVTFIRCYALSASAQLGGCSLGCLGGVFGDAAGAVVGFLQSDCYAGLVAVGGLTVLALTAYSGAVPVATLAVEVGGAYGAAILGVAATQGVGAETPVEAADLILTVGEQAFKVKGCVP